MGEYLELHAPQWMDFTESCSPIRVPDFFEKVQAIHERMEDCDFISKNMEATESASQTDTLCVNTEAQADLDIIKSTPVKMVSPKHRNNKETVTMETTYDQVLSDAMKKLELCKKPPKIREALSKTTQEPNAFKTPNMTKMVKSSRSVGFHSIPNKRQPGQDSAPRYVKVNKNVCTPSNIPVNIKKTSVSQSLFKQDKDTVNDSKPLNDPIKDSKDEDKQFDRKDNEVHKKEDDKESRDEPEEAMNDIKNNKEEENQDNEVHKEDNKESQDESEKATNDIKNNKEEENQDNKVHKKEDDKESQDEPEEITNDIKDNKEENQDNEVHKEDNKESQNESEKATNDIKNKEEENQDNKVHKKEEDKESQDEPEEITNDIKDNKEENQDNEVHKKEDNKESQDELEEATNDIKDNKEEEDNVDAATEKSNRMLSNKGIAVLTWHNHRRNIYKCRTSINKPYVSMAEAVSRFQNETPKRFRTRSNKDNTTTSFNSSKLIQNRLRPTIPISPALVSKNRMRPVTVLSQEERERLEMEEIKKHRIKANPIPPNVLRGPRAAMRVTGVAKKPTAVASTSSTMQLDEKACAASSLQSKLSPHHDRASSGLKNMVTKVVVTNPAGIIVEHEKMTFFGVPTGTGIVKNATRVVPFSFEARDKNLQMKKEQRLKNLQEMNKSKEFHARPAPNFSKPPTPPAKQQQKAKNPVRVPILPCPFSFEERDKNLSKRKEQLVRQVFEEDKRSRVFRASPVPVFKPVMVRGKSKERISIKDKNAKAGSEHREKCEDQENREPNINSAKIESENTQRMKNVADEQKAPLKIRPLELNTDKRARERREFDEKLKRKEMEEEAKRQEENKKRLELEKQMKAELRKQTEVKARPMPMYKPPTVVKAMKQLTNPQSPAFVRKTKPKQV